MADSLLATEAQPQEPNQVSHADPPDIGQLVATAQRGLDARLRIAAIAQLGQIGHAESQETLEGLLADRSDGIRAAAVSALGAMDSQQAVLKAAGDPSWRVRLQVARALASFPNRDGAAVADTLLKDASAEVQHSVVASVDKWPLTRSGPVLLAAMESRSLSTRRAGAERLAARWPAAAQFVADGPPQRRNELLKQLQEQFQQQFGLADREALASAALPQQPTFTLTSEQLDEIQRMLQQQDLAGLAQRWPDIVAALEQLVDARQVALPEAVYREVLPTRDPVFAILHRLQAREPVARRAAAEELATSAAKRPLRRLAVERLNQLVATEADPLVWRSVLLAVARDPSEPSTRLAYAAIGHASPEIRRRACEHLATHTDPKHATVLVPALEDPDWNVQCAAVRALGAMRRLDDTTPLRRLLIAGNEELHLETAAALVRLEDPAGKFEIERLTHSREARIRMRAAQVIGETGDPTFVPTLIRLLDDQPAICRAALASLPKVAGASAPADPSAAAATPHQQVSRWKQWAESRRGALPTTP